jgi:hypothetical protein
MERFMGKGRWTGMKKIKKLPKIQGAIGYFNHRETIYNLGILINAQSDAINYLVEVIEKLENRVQNLEKAGGQE